MKFLNQILTTAIICYLYITLGTLYILPSSTHKLFRSENTTLNRIMTQTELSFMGSMSSASTLIVTPFSGYLLDTLGRKRTLMLFYVPQLLAWALIGTIFRIEAFIFSMFLCGLSGSIYHIVPVYIGEYSDPSIRGAMASSGLIFSGVGVLMSYLLGGILDYYTMNYTGLAMTIVGLMLICFMKESPLYLMKRGSEEEAAKSIAFYKGIKCSSIEVVKEMENIRRLLSADIQIESTPEEQKLNPDKYNSRKKIPTWKYLAYEGVNVTDSYLPAILVTGMTVTNIYAKSQSSRRALATLLVIYTSCLFQGEPLVEMYAKPLFEEAVPSLTPTLLSVMYGIITIGAGLFGAYLMDTVGRRKVLIVSSSAVVLVCVLLGSHIQFSWGPNWLSAILLYLYSISYSVGPKCVPVVLMSEVFLPEIKSFATMVCIEWAFMCLFIITFMFNPLFDAYGLGPFFYLFAGFGCCTTILSYMYLPETKGLSADIIQQKFLKM